MPSCLLTAYQSLPIVRYDVHGVKRGKPKKMPFGWDATSLHYAHTASPYVPCIVVITCFSRIQSATTLVNGIKLAQSLRPWVFINRLSRYVNWDASPNVINGFSFSSHKRYTIPDSLVPEIPCPTLRPLLQTSRHVVQQLNRVSYRALKMP